MHLLLILEVTFVFPMTGASEQDTHPLKIVVLRRAAPSDKMPKIADTFAQVNRDGSGIEEVLTLNDKASIEPEPESQEPDSEVSALDSPPVFTPLPPFPEPGQAPEDQPQRLPQTQPLTAILKREPQHEQLLPEPSDDSPPPGDAPPPAVTAAEILASRNLEIAELTARIRHSSAVYANRPRRKAISASTREYKYASYMEGWRRKVERVGNLNYPEEAKRHKMYGNLLLHVAVRADGSIERIRVRRSSGFELLDEAAIKIVQLSAPFAPFPPDIRAETDIIDITRTWKFLSSNRLGWEN